MPLVSANLETAAVKPSAFDFDTVADRYDRWYETAEGAIYDRLEKRAFARYLSGKHEGRKLLEIGCGTGHWSRFFSECGFEVTGVDISERMIDIAKSKDISNASFQLADGHSLPYSDQTFDITAAVTTLEFARDAKLVVREMVRCTRKPGRVLFGVLNGLSKFNQQRANSPEGPYAAARLFTPVELKGLIEPFGQVEIAVASFVPTQSWLIPFAPWFDRIARMFKSQKGAFIAAALTL
jgi:SAM-dependent methyltransferase